MATLSRKRKSPEPSDSHAPGPNDHATPSRTPNGSPARKRVRITHSQKQALIDNLQLEVTERARKLRSQYALQAQDLRGRIERRVNRIPMALRKAKMGELLAKHSEYTKTADAERKAGTTSSKSSSKAVAGGTTGSVRGNRASTTRTTRGVKRTSDEMLASDKENAPFQVQDHHHQSVHVPLSNPKKRGTPNAHPAGHRVLSQFTETGVLSPKSSNSRTFPQSPLRNVTGKSQQQLGGNVRPSSPLKHASPIKSGGAGAGAGILAGMVENARTRSTRGTTTGGTRKASPTSDGTGTRRRTTAKSTASTTSKRAAPPSRPTTRQKNTRRNSGDSTISNVSSGTTIVKTTATARAGAVGSQKGTGARAVSGAATAANKRPPVPRGGRTTATTSAAAKKTAAAAGLAVKNAQAAEPVAASGKRVLRKRT